MINDVLLRFSDAQDIGQAVGSYVSSNSYDLGATAPGDIFQGEGFEFFAQIVEAVTSGTSSTVQVEVITASNADLTGTIVSHGLGPAIAHTLCTVGAMLPVPMPDFQRVAPQRYLGLRYWIGGATTTAGTVTAGMRER